MGCCRRVSHLVTDSRSHRAVEVAERFADGLATESELGAASGAAWQAANSTSDFALSTIAYATGRDANGLIGAYFMCEPGEDQAAEKEEVVILRDVVGNPFRPVALSPAWRSPAVLALAQAAYNNRILLAGILEPDRLAIVADALEEAGCNDADILGHLRGPGPHLRGCCAIDLILSKDR